MKKETFYKIAIAILVIMNLLQVGGRFMHHRSLVTAKYRVIDQLKLDKNQEQEFLVLVKNHRKSMLDLHTMQQEFTQAYFNQPSDALMQEVILIEEEKIKITAQHFADIKSLLNEDQYASFEEFKNKAIENILRLNSNDKPPKN